MIVILHIIIALTSVAGATILLISPSKIKLIVNYLLVGATLASGIALTIADPAQMLRTCTTGLVYTVLVTAGIMMAQTKLQRRSLLALETQDVTK